jgi:hypothetical protein
MQGVKHEGTRAPGIDGANTLTSLDCASAALRSASDRKVNIAEYLHTGAGFQWGIAENRLF